MKIPAGLRVEGCPSRVRGLFSADCAQAVLHGPPDVLRHLAATLPRQWRRYRKRLQRCQQKFSAAAVHDSRIETRRLQATLELLAAFIPERELKKPRRALKKHLDAFDNLRDTQVQMAFVKPVRRAFPAAHAFHAWLCQRETRFIREARKAVKQIKTRRVGKRIAAFERELRCQRKHTTPEEAFRIAQSAIRLAFVEVSRRCRRVRAADTRTIHRTRIAFKRFRYMVEALSPLLPAVTDKHRAAMRRYQALMGEVQDMNVLLAALDEFTDAGECHFAAQPLRAEFVRRGEQLVHRYIAAAPNLWSFQPMDFIPPRLAGRKNKNPGSHPGCTCRQPSGVARQFTQAT